MNNNFWKQLPNPFFALAPMHEITDPAFRQIMVECGLPRLADGKAGKPEVMFTEFVSVDGLCSQGKDALLPMFRFTEEERPIVAQLFGSRPEHFFEAAKLVAELGFDGVDINMGCPDKTIMKQGAGSALIGQEKLVKDIIMATRDGAGSIAVSVKTRTGIKSEQELEAWASFLLAQDLDAITLHCRTAREMYLPGANWNAVADLVKMAEGSGTVIVGNGDVANLEDGKKKAEESGAAGAMIGRAILNNPWMFNEAIDPKNIGKSERLQLLLRHARKYEELYRGRRNFSGMKKFFKMYSNYFPGAKELRMEMMKANSVGELEEIIKGSL